VSQVGKNRAGQDLALEVFSCNSGSKTTDLLLCERLRHGRTNLCSVSDSSWTRAALCLHFTTQIAFDGRTLSHALAAAEVI